MQLISSFKTTRLANRDLLARSYNTQGNAVLYQKVSDVEKIFPAVFDSSPRRQTNLREMFRIKEKGSGEK